MTGTTYHHSVKFKEPDDSSYGKPVILLQFTIKDNRDFSHIYRKPLKHISIPKSLSIHLAGMVVPAYRPRVYDEYIIIVTNSLSFPDLQVSFQIHLSSPYRQSFLVPSIFLPIVPLGHSTQSTPYTLGFIFLYRRFTAAIGILDKSS